MVQVVLNQPDQPSNPLPANEPARSPDPVGFELSNYSIDQDPDAVALAEAKKEADALERGEQAPSGPAPTDPTGKTPAAAPQAAPKGTPAAAPPAQPVTIPKARFDEVIADRTQLAEDLELAQQQLAYMQGVLEANKIKLPSGDQPTAEPGQGGGTAPTGPQPADLQTKLDELFARREQIESDYEDTKIDGKTRVKQLNEIDREVTRIQTDIARHAAAEQAAAIVGSVAQVPQGSAMDTLIEDRQAAVLEDQFPVLKQLSQGHLDFLSDMAHREAAALGNPYKGGTLDNLRLRQEVAKLATFYAPRWGIEVQPAATPAPNGGGQTPPVPKLSRQAQARADKLALADQLPPNTSQVGSRGETTQVTADDIAHMSDDDIQQKLTPAQRAAFLT